MKYYYVYYSFEEWGRGYIGYRCSTLPPEQDNYFGSFKDPTFKPTQKIVLGTFSSKKEAVRAEISLHNFFQVHVNSHFANRAKQTAEGFSGGMANKKHSFETREKMKAKRALQPNRPCSPETALKIGKANKGKVRSKEFCETTSKRLKENNPNSLPGVKEKKSKRLKGGKWIHKGSELRYLHKGEPLPEGWNFGRGLVGNGRKIHAD